MMLPLLAVSDRRETWIIFAAMAGYGLESTLAYPAEDALFAELFSTEFRRRINGWRLAIQETGRLVAPLLGAALFVALGGGAVAALDSATVVHAPLAQSRLRVPAGPTRPSERPPLARELSAGARQLWREPELRAVALGVTAVMALSGAGVAASYSLVTGLGQRPAFLGVLSALLGAGSILAALTAGRLIAHVGERWLAVIGIVDLAVGDVLRATGWLPAAVLGTVVLGFALPYAFLAILNLAQRRTPDELQGRVSAALDLALFGPQAPLQVIGALLIAHATYSEIYLGSAILSAVVAAWLASV